MTLGDLESLFEKILEIINYYESTNFNERKNKLFLGNGDRLNYCVPKECVAHLLGINTTYLVSTGLFKTTNSFELVKKLCENAYYIYNLSKQKVLNLDKLFSPYIFEKIEIFKDNINIYAESVELVCKYDSNRSFINQANSENYDYIIVKKYENGKIGILCLVDNFGLYTPRSSQIYNSFEEAQEKLSKLLKFQEVTILKDVNIYSRYSDYNKTYHLNLDAIIKKTRKLTELYKKEFNCSIDVSSAFLFSIDKQRQNRDQNFANLSIVEKIVECIEKGKIIATKDFNDNNLLEIANAFNNYLFSTHQSQDSKLTSTYTDLKTELENLKQICTELKIEKEEINKTNQELIQKNSILTEENLEKQSILSEIAQILKKKV